MIDVKDEGPNMADEELVTGAEAARYLGITRSRINKLAHEGRLGRQIAGRFYVFTRGELVAWKAAPKSKGGRPKSSAPSLSRPVGGDAELAAGE